jgi:hypothetical protein
MARPRKALDAEEIRKLSAFGCTGEEIANFVGCGRRTLVRRFQADIEAGRAAGAVRAKAVLFRKAMDGEMTALSLYLLNHCHWITRGGPETLIQVTQNAAAVVPPTPEALRQHLASMRAAIEQESRRNGRQ